MVDEIHVKQIIGKALYESMAPKEYTTKDTIRLHFMLYIYIIKEIWAVSFTSLFCYKLCFYDNSASYLYDINK